MAKYDILLMGDGTSFLRTIGWVLEYKGFAVKTAATPEAALEALVKKNYDLVVVQLTPDGLEGLDVLKRAKRLNPEARLMVISGNRHAVFPLEVYEVEVDDYLLMPVSPTELWRRVHNCLEEREVVDLQPVAAEAGSFWDGEPADTQMMLMLHDIRGSLVSAAASLKLLARGTYGEVSASARAKLHGVAARIERTTNLTKDFIGKVMADQGRGAKEADVLDLTQDVVEPVLAEMAGEIQDHQISLVNRLPAQVDGKIPVRGGKVWLQSVFRNLISNGIKYGGGGSTIVIDFETNGSNCRLHVYNTGQTVPEASRAMLFSYGPRMARYKKSRQGLGLGLSLCRNIVQNHGGDLWYEAKSDGSNFVVTLPQN